MGMSTEGYRIDCDAEGCDYYMEFGGDEMMLRQFWVADGGTGYFDAPNLTERYYCKEHSHV